VAQEFVLTPQPITVTAAQRQLLAQAMEVSDFDSVHALLTALNFSGTSYTGRIITGMQKETETGWVEALTFGSQTTTGQWAGPSVVLLKYIRWEISAFNGTTLTFFINGMLRTN
jgi:hypothetical protein